MVFYILLKLIVYSLIIWGIIKYKKIKGNINLSKILNYFKFY